MKNKIIKHSFLISLFSIAIINFSWCMSIPEISERSPRTYYVSATKGSDLNSGLSEKTPWKTLEKVSQADILPGDSILFKSGDVFIGQLAPGYSGKESAPITFSSYGKGSKPVINGSTAEGGDFVAAVLLHNQQCFNISNLEITNERRVTRAGISDKDAFGIYVLADSANVLHHFNFSGLTIKNVFTPNSLHPFDQKIAGIYFCSYKGRSSQIKNICVNNCYFTYTGSSGMVIGHGPAPSVVNNDDTLNHNMNIVLTNNHVYKIGGPGFVVSKGYNVLLEHNVFEYTGFNGDSRMAKRGSGAWFNGCTNVMAQYNTSKHVRGNGDSYGMHIDFGNKYAIFQYNYFEDIEGGFVEILGKNYQVAERFNISVNCGFRKSKGNTIWFDTYVGETSKRINSNMVFVYNNSVYLNQTLQGDSIRSGIVLNADTAFIYNNIIYAGKNATVGLKLYVLKGGPFTIDNNLYYGNINKEFINQDKGGKLINPLYVNAGGTSPEDYKLLSQSPAIGSGKRIQEVSFPMPGKGIFKNITSKTMVDYFGNPVNFSKKVNIGAYNGKPLPIKKRY